jgi:hypothetical protein
MNPRVFQAFLYTRTLRFEVSNGMTSYGYAQHLWQGRAYELSLALHDAFLETLIRTASVILLET